MGYSREEQETVLVFDIALVSGLSTLLAQNTSRNYGSLRRKKA